MTEVRATSIEIRAQAGESASETLGELVMAWARDIKTGEPRYIGEIDAEHRGGKCGCECPSCSLPLIAVNAAKHKVIRRPHFRHPEGAHRNECSILVARAAALRLLTEEGVIDLPHRRLCGEAEGLSGALYEAWVEVPAQRFRVARIDYRDRVFATLTLDDGRELRVVLSGHVDEVAASEAGVALVPTITIDVSDASLAGMDQAEIRRRLQLLPETLCWRSHWNDADLLAEARQRATAQAIGALDWVPDGIELSDGLSPSTRRESKSPAADAYLVKLGLFKLDGEAGSEYSCAASKRAKRYATLMRRQLTVFAKDNACWRFAATRKVDPQKLCATRKEFARRVEQSRNVPLPDREGACSY